MNNVWIYDNVFVWDKGCDSVVVFPFHYNFPIFFVYNFKLVKYVSEGVD
jgi:hypothetical protein